MSRSYKKSRTGKSPRHVRLYHYMLQSKAWLSLSPNARAIYIEIVSRYAGVNNGRIPYAVRDAASALRIGTATASRALNELQQRGFIVPVTKGAFSLKKRHATEWRLTEFTCDVSNAAFPTKEFMKWGVAPNAARTPLVY
jgi:hypothetical protein